jgi:beta-glucosidase
MTFPRNVGQVPIYYNHKNTGRPTAARSNDVFWSHYSDVSNDPLYEFGYGLSYTSFKYDNLKLSKSKFSKNEEMVVRVQLTNTGSKDGEEVVQLYIRDLAGSVTRPVRELKGFEKVALKAGESKIITFTINAKVLQFYTANNKWEVEPGDFYIWIGGSSDAKLKSSFTVVE